MKLLLILAIIGIAIAIYFNIKYSYDISDIAISSILILLAVILIFFFISMAILLFAPTVTSQDPNEKVILNEDTQIFVDNKEIIVVIKKENNISEIKKCNLQSSHFNSSIGKKQYIEIYSVYPSNKIIQWLYGDLLSHQEYQFYISNSNLIFSN